MSHSCLKRTHSFHIIRFLFAYLKLSFCCPDEIQSPPKWLNFFFICDFFFLANAIKWNDALMKFAWRNIYFKIGMVCNSLRYSCCFTNEFSSQRVQTTTYFFQHSAIHILTKNTSNVVFNHNLFNDSMVLTAFAFI